jgi:hypothetical protein
MTWLYAVQFATPLILIGWLVWLPARSGLGFMVQVVASIAALAVMALQGIWLLPPWWAPYLFAVALGVGAWLGWRRIQPFASTTPTTRGAWAVMILFIALGATSTSGTFIAVQSRTNTVAGLVNLAFPLEPGRYLVVNGGSNIDTNAHLETLDASVPRYRAFHPLSNEGIWRALRLETGGPGARRIGERQKLANDLRLARQLGPDRGFFQCRCNRPAVAGDPRC